MTRGQDARRTADGRMPSPRGPARSWGLCDPAASLTSFATDPEPRALLSRSRVGHNAGWADARPATPRAIANAVTHRSASVATASCRRPCGWRPAARLPVPSASAAALGSAEFIPHAEARSMGGALRDGHRLGRGWIIGGRTEVRAPRVPFALAHARRRPAGRMMCASPGASAPPKPTSPIINHQPPWSQGRAGLHPPVRRLPSAAGDGDGPGGRRWPERKTGGGNFRKGERRWCAHDAI